MSDPLETQLMKIGFTLFGDHTLRAPDDCKLRIYIEGDSFVLGIIVPDGDVRCRVPRDALKVTERRATP